MTIRLTQRILQYLTGNKNAPTQNRVGAQTVDKVAKPCQVLKRNSIRGPRQIENLVGKRRKERSVYYEFQRNSFKHGISFDVS